MGLVDMWITPLKDVKTVYLHVDRLCVKQGKLFTLFSYYFKISLISSTCFCNCVSVLSSLEIFSWAWITVV